MNYFGFADYFGYVASAIQASNLLWNYWNFAAVR